MKSYINISLFNKQVANLQNKIAQSIYNTLKRNKIKVLSLIHRPISGVYVYLDGESSDEINEFKVYGISIDTLNKRVDLIIESHCGMSTFKQLFENDMLKELDNDPDLIHYTMDETYSPMESLVELADAVDEMMEFLD